MALSLQDPLLPVDSGPTNATPPEPRQPSTPILRDTNARLLAGDMLSGESGTQAIAPAAETPQEPMSGRCGVGTEIVAVRRRGPRLPVRREDLRDLFRAAVIVSALIVALIVSEAMFPTPDW